MLTAGRIEEYKEFSNFSSLKEFNNAVEQFLAVHKKDFTKGELIAFKRLVRFAAKYFGVANAKIGTLVKAINKLANGFGISRSTFERMLRKAQRLGILTVKNTVKSKGGKGHNVYVFNSIDVLKKEKLTYCESANNPCGSKDEQSKNEGETSNLETSNLINNKRKGQRFDASFTKSFVPKEFKEAVRPFFDDASTIEDFWKSVHIDTRTIKDIVNPETITYTAVDAFKQSVRSYKKGRVKSSLVQYFTGTFRKLMDKAYSDIPYSEFK
ncbi:hypothetical protein AB1K84_25265 [Mesobacillus foraminis]|uniref:hypothetical protein n=1 Tax=Mesobacillus foraminis TaxID=279826 RepID=UPI0039A20F82